MNRTSEFYHCGGLFGALDSRFTLKGSGPVYAPDRTFDTDHVRLDLRVDPFKKTMKAHCQTTLRAITDNASRMTFDAVNFIIERVKWDGKPTSYTYKKGKLVVKAGQRVKEGQSAVVDIFYRLKDPKMGIYFLRPDRSYPDRPHQVWTQGQDEYARYWFPCNDTPGQRLTTEVLATVPKDFMALSNGRLAKTIQNKKEKTTTYHWVQSIPHAPYLVTLAVGRFKQIKDKWKNIPVHYYCEKGREQDTKRAFSKTPKMLEFFSKSIGVTYPYDKYAQVAVNDFIYGGMENTSATTQTDSALLDKRAALDYTSDELVAHELAHQWFGDYLTCKDWSHAWLNESFATYFDALFKRHDRGEDEFLYAIYQNSHAYFDEDKEHYRRPIVTHVYKNPTDLFDRHLYEKGSVILYMLHHLLGEDLFWKSINTYVKTNKTKTVETLNLIEAIEAATGRNMKRYFDQWIFSAGHPTFQIKSWYEPRKKEIHFRLNQSNAFGGERVLHHMSSEFLIVTKKGEKRFPVQLGQKSQHLHFKIDGEPLMILFDPDHRLLKKIQFPRTQDMLIHQLSKAANPLARIEAAYELGRVGSERAIMALRDALVTDSFWGVRAEVAQALGSVQSEKSATMLLNSLDVVEDHKVRRSIYSALGRFQSEHIAKEVGKRCVKERSYFSEANGYRTVGALKHPHAREILFRAMEKESWNGILKMAALDGLSQLKSPGLIPYFIKMTKYGVAHRVRMAAIRALIPIGQMNNDVQNRLVELTQDPFLLVQIGAVRALHRVGDERVVPALKKLTIGDWDGRLKRLAEEAILSLTKGSDGAKN